MIHHGTTAAACLLAALCVTTPAHADITLSGTGTLTFSQSLLDALVVPNNDGSGSITAVVGSLDNTVPSAGAVVSLSDIQSYLGAAGSTYASPYGSTGLYLFPPISLELTPTVSVPEPSTFVLISLGLTALAWRTRRNKQV